MHIYKLDYLFVLRPMLFFPGWSTLLAGYLINYKTELYLPFNIINDFDYINIILLFVSFAMIMGATFILNQLVDKDSDKINSKLFFISKKYISQKKAIIEVIVLIILGLMIGYFLSTQVLILYMIFILLTGYFYNYKPFEFKNKPFLSLFSNALMGWLAFSIGWSMNNTIGLSLLIDSSPYLFFNIALYLFTTLPDIEGDRSIKKNTLAVRHGYKSIILSAFFIFGLGFVSAGLLNDYLALIFYWLSLPFFILTIITFKISHTMITTKYAILFFSLSICLKVPYYIVLMVAGFFVTKVYYKLRFNFDYPNFSGK